MLPEGASGGMRSIFQSGGKFDLSTAHFQLDREQLVTRIFRVWKVRALSCRGPTVPGSQDAGSMPTCEANEAGSSQIRMATRTQLST